MIVQQHHNPNHLMYAVFSAVLLHAFIILGITFVAPQGAATHSMEVTLALHKSNQANLKADFLAQANQQGSGQLDKMAEMTTTQVVDFVEAQVNQITPEDQMAFKPPPQAAEHRLIVTHRFSRTKVAPSQHKKPQPTEYFDDGLIQMSAQSAAIASLEARLAQKRQIYAKKPKTHTVSSLSAREDYAAGYIDTFRQNVERMGNLHYPDVAKQRHLRGEVRLLVVVLPSGKVKDIQVRSSSGYGVLDEAARRSVRLAEPFPPFTKAMRKEMDVLQIIRTWRFAESMYNES